MPGTATIGWVVQSAASSGLRDATNTGIVGAGISEGSLTTTAGATYNSSFNGQTITGKKFTDTVTVTGTNITISGCLFEAGPASFARSLVSDGTNLIVEDCTFRTSSGSTYQHIWHTGASLTVRRCDISSAENNMTIEGDNCTVEDSYLHDSSNASNPSGHRDCIEIYLGSGTILRRNTLIHPAGETAAINIAPWSGSNSVDETTISDNYIDGGNMHIIVDLQSTGTIQHTRVVRNIFGGHTDPGVIGDYIALVNSDGRTIVESEAALTSTPNGILWPSSGADKNVWGYCVSNPFGYSDLSPDNTGNTVTS